METYQVNILALTNAEDAFNKLGEGTLIIDDLRDEVRVTGRRVATWVMPVLIVAFILGLLVPAGTLKGTLMLGIIAIAIFRKSIFPKQELAVRFTQADLGLVGRGTNKHEGSVVISDVPGESGDPKKWVTVRPQSEADAEKIIDACTKLRDG